MFRYLEAESLTPYLYELIKLSAAPLKSVETDFAIDSSGFSTGQFMRWFDVKYGKAEDRRMWLKVHLMCGVKTNIARNSRVGEGTPAEWKPQGVKFFDKVARTTPEKAAEVIVTGIKNRNPRILIGSDARGISLFSRMFPRNYLRIIERLAGHKMSLRKL